MTDDVSFACVRRKGLRIVGWLYGLIRPEFIHGQSHVMIRHHRQFLLLISLSLSCVVVQVHGQSDTSVTGTEHEFVPEWYDMFTNIPGNYVRFGKGVFNPSSIPVILGVSAATAILIATDEDTYRFQQRIYETSPPAKGMSDIFVWVGDGRPQFGLAAAFGLYGFLANDARSLRTASQTVEAILSVGIVVQVLKHVTGRESPLVSTIPGGRWQWFPNQIEYHRNVPHYDAFPSGHLATALATVTVVAENYDDIWWIRPVGYTLCGLLGLAMVDTGIHWYSDYPLAIALGYSFGMIAAHPPAMTLSSRGPDDHVQFSVLPLLSSVRMGVQVMVSF